MKQKLVAALLCVSMVLTMTACGTKKGTEESQGEEKKDNKKQEETIKLTVAESYRSDVWGAQYLAEALGYYEEEGLDVELTTIQGDSPAAALFADEAQILFFGSEAVPMFNQEGQECKILMGFNSRIGMSLVGAPEIKSISDLKGKVISAAESGSSPRAFAASVLSKNEIDPVNDVTYVSVSVPGSMAALASGEIQCAYASGSLLQAMIAQGNNLLADMSNPEEHKKYLGSEDYTTHVAIATDKFIKENPEAVQKFTNAVYKAILWMDQASAEEIAEKLTPYFEGREEDPKEIQRQKDEGEFNSTGDITDTAYDAIISQVKNAGWISEDMPREENVDDSFLKNSQKNVKLD